MVGFRWIALRVVKVTMVIRGWPVRNCTILNSDSFSAGQQGYTKDECEREKFAEHISFVFLFLIIISSLAEPPFK